MEKFNLSERMIGYTYEAKQDVFFLDDVKEFIKRIKFWGKINLANDTLTIKYSKFKELAGDKLCQ